MNTVAEVVSQWTKMKFEKHDVLLVTLCEQDAWSARDVQNQLAMQMAPHALLRDVPLLVVSDGVDVDKLDERQGRALLVALKARFEGAK